MKRFWKERKKNTTVDTSYAIVTNEIDQFEGWHERSLIWETAHYLLIFSNVSKPHYCRRIR